MPSGQAGSTRAATSRRSYQTTPFTPAQVRLSGLSGEFRAGWLSSDAARIRVRLEAGLGVLWGHAQAAIVVDQPKSRALAAQEFERVYGLVAATFEWPLGPAWIAAGVQSTCPIA